MTKKKIDIDKYTSGLFLRTEQYADKVRRHFASAVDELLKMSANSRIGPDETFSFGSNKKLSEKANAVLRGLYSSVYNEIKDGVSAEWEYANLSCDALIESIFGKGLDEDNHFARWFSRNQEAMDSFFARKSAYGGMNLSQKVWKYTGDLKTEMELALSASLGQGDSASTVSRKVRQYLQEPDKLFRRIKTGVDENGNPKFKLSKAAKAYHPGQGVYRSSYKNAMRLTRTETNMAYRAAEQDRWQRMDFVVGYEVKINNNHPTHDICDELKGKYPKDFKFVGWHPQCRCYVVPILAEEDEFIKMQEKILAGEDPTSIKSGNTVRNAPDNFNEWVENNKERAKGWVSMPYFIKQNPQFVKGFEIDTYTKAERKFTRARKTDEAMKESLGIFLQNKYPDIPNTEKAAIFHYTKGEGAAFRQLNNQLRKGELSEFNEAFAELLSQGLSRLETTPKTVYRTIRLNKTKLRAFIELSSRQGKSVFDGYTSTTLDRSTAIDFATRHLGRKKNETDVLLVIQGKSGHPISDLSQYGGRFKGKPNQHEVLFDRGCEFRFDKVKLEEGTYVFYLTEI